jgi:ABC-2 type transport system permease protein
MNAERVATLIGKELRELRAAPAAVLPVLILAVISTLLPFLLVVIVPRTTGQSVAADRSLQHVVALARVRLPGLAALSPEHAAEAFLYQQFLVLFVVAPIVGAVSLAAYSVVGEKQSRTLEPLLTTPLTTAELLVAKVVAALLPALAIEAAAVCVYVIVISLVSAPGVAAAVITSQTVILVCLVGPVASLAALQLTIAVSSRVNDPRSAQQIAVLLVLPFVVALFGQLSGAFVLTTPILLLISATLVIVWILLVMLSVTLFDRETILTRWK